MTPCRDNHRRLVTLALTCTLVASAGAAATKGAVGTAGDPLHAPECGAAIASLRARESDADVAACSDSTGARAPSAALLAARRDTARRCLASRADPPEPPGRLIQPPIVVAPIAVPAPMPAGTIAHRAPPIAPTRAPIRGPRTITSCDAGGCWTSDGTRVDRFGPDLRDRRGVCTLSGAVLQCP